MADKENAIPRQRVTTRRDSRRRDRSASPASRRRIATRFEERDREALESLPRRAPLQPERFPQNLFTGVRLRSDSEVKVDDVWYRRLVQNPQEPLPNDIYDRMHDLLVNYEEGKFGALAIAHKAHFDLERLLTIVTQNDHVYLGLITLLFELGARGLADNLSNVVHLGDVSIIRRMI